MLKSRSSVCDLVFYLFLFVVFLNFLFPLTMSFPAPSRPSLPGDFIDPPFWSDHPFWSDPLPCYPPRPAYYQLVLQLPHAFCFNNQPWRCKSINPPGGFTMHGVWLQNQENRGPCPGEEFTTRKLERAGLLPLLRRYWPSLTGADTDFWNEQWQKHGTCTGLPLVEYFWLSVNKGSHYIEKLDEGKRRIPPGGRPHNTGNLKLQLEGIIGNKIVMKCNLRRDGSQDQLLEIVICLDRDWNPMDCPLSLRTTCDSDFTFLPSF